MIYTTKRWLVPLCRDSTTPLWPSFLSAYLGNTLCMSSYGTWRLVTSSLFNPKDSSCRQRRLIQPVGGLLLVSSCTYTNHFLMQDLTYMCYSEEGTVTRASYFYYLNEKIEDQKFRIHLYVWHSPSKSMVSWLLGELLVVTSFAPVRCPWTGWLPLGNHPFL